MRRGNLPPVDVHKVQGNAGAVVNNCYGVVDVNGDFDLRGETGQRFVHRIVDHFIDEVVQAEIAGRADVHGRTLAHSFHAADHLDGVGGVVVVAAAITSGHRRHAS